MRPCHVGSYVGQASWQPFAAACLAELSRTVSDNQRRASACRKTKNQCSVNSVTYCLKIKLMQTGYYYIHSAGQKGKQLSILFLPDFSWWLKIFNSAKGRIAIFSSLTAAYGFNGFVWSWCPFNTMVSSIHESASKTASRLVQLFLNGPLVCPTYRQTDKHTETTLRVTYVTKTLKVLPQQPYGRCWSLVY